MEKRYSSEPAWAGAEDQHPRGVPVVRNDRYWLYAEEAPEGWHITGVRANVEHGLEEVRVPAEVDGKPVLSLRMDWTYDPEHPAYIGQLYFPDCIPGVDGRSLRYVFRAMPEKTEHPCFMEKENLLLTPDGKTVVAALVMYQRYYFVPDGVENIAAYAFAERRMDRVFLPGSLCSIGEQAFAGTFRLRGMVVPEGVTSIGDGAFADSGAVSVILPDSLEMLGAGAFAGSDILEVTIPPRVRKLKKTFMYCRDLCKLHLSEGLQEIGPYAFQACDSLRRVALPASVQRVDDNAFAGGDAEVVRC